MSISFEDFIQLASTGAYKVDLEQASLGASAGMILQTVRRANSSPPNPLDGAQLDGSQWVSSEGDTLVLKHLFRHRKKNRDDYEVTRNG